MKTCRKCGQDLPLEKFHKNSASSDGRQSYCKDCSRQATKDSYHKHAEEKRAADRERYKSRKEYCKENNRAWREANTEQHRANAREWYRANKERVIARNNASYHKKYRKDHAFRLDRIIRRHARRVIEMLGTEKSFDTYKAVGYSPQELKAHIEQQFQNGMCWDNYGEWHIDHIRPISSFISEGNSDAGEINALSNLQPLWAKDNLRKGAQFGESTNQTTAKTAGGVPKASR